MYAELTLSHPPSAPPPTGRCRRTWPPRGNARGTRRCSWNAGWPCSRRTTTWCISATVVSSTWCVHSYLSVKVLLSWHAGPFL